MHEVTETRQTELWPDSMHVRSQEESQTAKSTILAHAKQQIYSSFQRLHGFYGSLGVGEIIALIILMSLGLLTTVRLLQSRELKRRGTCPRSSSVGTSSLAPLALYESMDAENLELGEGQGEMMEKHMNDLEEVSPAVICTSGGRNWTMI